MMPRRLMMCVTAMLSLMLPAAVRAADPVPPLLTSRAADLLTVFQGGGDVTALFAPDFLAHVPEAQVRSISTQIATAFGKPLRIDAIEPVSPTSGKLRVAYARSVVTFGMTLDPAAPNRIVGLRVLDTGGATPAAPAAPPSAAVPPRPGS